MSTAAVEALAAQVGTVVGTVVAASVGASLAGAASGPGALAVIGQVQMLSQMGKVGGGGGALSTFSESFGWANAELPFSLVPVDIAPAANDGTARRSFRRNKMLDSVRVGETVEQQDPKCKKEDLSEEEVAQCRKCGMINGVTLLDKLIVVFGSFVAVFAIRWFCQFFITCCLKREPWDMLKFPGWEGPLLLAHWFGMCESLTKTMGRPCSLWYAVSAVILFVGPVCFMIYAIFDIRRHIAQGAIHFDVHENITWGQARAEMRKTQGCFGKLRVIQSWWSNKRHKGEWVEDTEASKFWAFVLKDLHGKSWFYFVWLLAKKLLLAAAMSLTMDHSNAVFVLALQAVDVVAVLYSWPNSDNLTNAQEIFGMMSNLLTIICAALPSFGFELPDFLGDFALICLALAGTAVAAVSSLLGPVFLLLGKAQSLFGVLLQQCSGASSNLSSNLESGVMNGIVGAATAGVFDSLAEVVEDGMMEHLAGDDEEDDHGDTDVGGAGTAMAVGVGVGVAVAYGSSLSQVEGQEKEEKHGTERLHKKENVGCEVNSEFPSVHFTIKLLLDFELVGYCFAKFVHACMHAFTCDVHLQSVAFTLANENQPAHKKPRALFGG
jgi:hypothetical protein